MKINIIDPNKSTKKNQTSGLMGFKQDLNESQKET